MKNSVKQMPNGSRSAALMKSIKLSNTYMSYFCLELHLLINAGISVSNAISLICEKEQRKEYQTLLMRLNNIIDNGYLLSDALRETKVFDKYMIDMIELGEKTGHLDKVLKALSKYYERLYQVERSIKNAIAYPAISLVLIVVIAGILVTKVLPIFEKIFTQMGRSMPPLALFLLDVGAVLNSYWYILCTFLIIALVLFWVMMKKNRPQSGLSRIKFTRSINTQICSSRFLTTMALALSSGMDIDDSLSLADRIMSDSKVSAKIEKCKTSISEGSSFPDAVMETGLIDSTQGHIIQIAFRTGQIDSVFEELAQRMEVKVDQSIDSFINMIEPTFVIGMCIVIGTILLSAILPLIEIMTSIS